jgi:hypothetical protein
MGVSVWPTFAGGFSALVVYLLAAGFIEQRRVRNRRAALKQRLLR